MQSPDPCCQHCNWLDPVDEAPVKGRCCLRSADILDPAWTVCNNFTSDCIDSTTLPEPDGPIYIDAGAFPDHLQPVHDWDKYLDGEIQKRNRPFRSLENQDLI